MKFITDISVYDIEKRRFPDKHYEYIIRVKWSDGVVNVVYRRYSQFYELHSQLVSLFPVQGGVYRQNDRTIPFLPGKILFGRSHIRKVALERLQPINDYCEGLIKLPENISKCNLVLRFFETSSIDLLPRESVKQLRRESKKSIKSISQPIALEQYQVLEDYQKEEKSELTITAGEVVEVVEQRDTGWWYVKSDTGEGWVPSSYLQSLASPRREDKVLPLTVSESYKYICIRHYEPQESDEIRLDKGCQVEVLEKNLDGWWLVRYKGNTGRAPAIYLSRTDTLKACRIRDLQVMQENIATDDLSDEFSSSDNSNENLNLSWEGFNAGSNAEPLYVNEIREDISKKPLRPPPPPPPVPTNRQLTQQLPPGLGTNLVRMYNNGSAKPQEKMMAESKVAVANGVNTPKSFPLPNFPVLPNARPAPFQTKAPAAVDTKPKVFVPKPSQLKNAAENNGKWRKDGVSPSAIAVSDPVPEFYKVRLKPVQASPNPGQSEATKDVPSKKPLLPPKPKT